ncbi:MAG TPA: helix-turn-helix domain-containing protein [Gemmataceae bacterium]|nr:helix-turn-helix domain-containing protein [Gemmataceae bacterium]
MAKAEPRAHRSRGRPPGRQRRQDLAALRARGWTYQQIGERLGMSHQSVQQTLRRTGNARLVPNHCRKCQARGFAIHWA